MAILKPLPIKDVAVEKPKSAYQSKKAARAKMSLRELAINDMLESYRKQIKDIFPKAVFDTEFVLGIDIPQYLKYLEDLMQPGMSWEDKKGKWRVGSIKKANQFNLTTGEGFYNFFNYKNRKPEWMKPKGFIADPSASSPLDRDDNAV